MWYYCLNNGGASAYKLCVCTKSCACLTQWTNSWYSDNLFIGHFGINKTQELIVRKYYWPMLRWDVEVYVKGYNICLASKAIWYKPYRNLQSLPVSTHSWKDLSMNFVTELLVLTDWKDENDDSILVIIDKFTKMIYYKPMKITIDIPGLLEVMIDIVVRHHDLPDSIIMDPDSLFMSKFLFLLCYFLGIKKKLSTVFYP